MKYVTYKVLGKLSYASFNVSLLFDCVHSLFGLVIEECVIIHNAVGGKVILSHCVDMSFKATHVTARLCPT